MMKTAAVIAFLAVAIYVVFHQLPKVTFKTYTSGAIVVTGTSSGIGKHAAVSLAQKGFTVFATVRKQKDVDALNKLDIKTLKPIIMDVTKHDQVVQAVAVVKASKLPLVGLVNNAGISSRAPLEAYDMDRIRWTYDVNVFGLVDTTQQFLPLLRQHQGRIVNIGSVAGLIALDGAGVYSGTKFAVEAMTDSLRRELLPHGVSVSIVEPAYVKTAIGDKSSGEQASDKWVSKNMLQTYASFFDGADERRQRAFANADTPECTTTAIEDALLSPTPATRYVVANTHGIPAWITAKLMWLLPDRAADAFLTRQDSVTQLTAKN
eukprot:TRINITY_DN3627_c0_g1_i1.p1 TRINITY_DN3627_c0_g1~~TRINITY_DN3627_c0_g1_i1.p1  ORF type:complete len:320 (+),score=90.82 TRINITY_DN3627_c0_g1_i1:64-1023(+)